MNTVNTQTSVASANLLFRLPRDAAREALRVVVDRRPDLIGLQEWYPARLRLLCEFGPVAPIPLPARAWLQRQTGDYRWWAPWLGGCAVAARADRYAPISCRSVPLSLPGRADRGERPLDIEPGRVASVLRVRDLRRDRTVALVDYHLVSGVQRRGLYRDDRPKLAGRHRGERTRVERLVTALLEQGDEVYAVGDSNFDGLRLPGLTSAWEGREDEPGTYGARRHIDDVHGPGPAAEVVAFETGSDHRALLVTR